jgi:hypothetical protein
MEGRLGESTPAAPFSIGDRLLPVHCRSPIGKSHFARLPDGQIADESYPIIWIMKPSKWSVTPWKMKVYK